MAPTFLSAPRSSPEARVKREPPSASSPPFSRAANLTSPPPSHPRRRSLRIPRAPHPPWDPREDSLIRNLQSGTGRTRWDLIAFRINTLRLGRTREAEECRLHWIWDLSNPAQRTPQAGSKRTHDTAVAEGGLEEETARAAPRNTANLRVEIPSPAHEETETETQPPATLVEPAAPRPTYVDAAALKAAAEATTSAQEQPNTPGYFYNCLLLVQDRGDDATDLRSVAEWMAKTVAPGEPHTPRHFLLGVCARYKDATGVSLKLGRLLKAISNFLAAKWHGNKSQWLGWCSMVRQAGMTVEEMEAERELHVTDKVRRREEEVRSGRFKWFLVAALYDELERRAS